ncbi:flagellar FlbD family protein [Eubacterium xylanophilum]|uniref:flagellar FlbD family protein n=1 Tax=Eubacterium xylanophilum TaxID=39497 RepID=UPI00047BE458|nr:flagellar FlbD family protein [Eubacterium xylanophilum]MCR5797212.1 flagellar FlbD family protein [Eubacterium sp.]
MIELTRMNGQVFSLNCDLIETVDETPDTVISLTTGKKLVVMESRQEITDMIIEYKNRIFSNK